MFRHLPWLFIFLIANCTTNHHKNMAIFNYTDFGPQVIASEIIGMEWWQWQPHGESRPTQYNIKVIVYRKTTLDEVKRLYPVVPEKKKDYRYLSYDTAITYLDEKITENIVDDVTIQLKATKEHIVNTLGNDD